MQAKIRIALREYVAFETALASQIDSFRVHYPGIAIEFVPMDLESLYRELVTERGLASGKWDLGLVVTDWLPQFIEAKLLEDLTPYLSAGAIPDWPAGWPNSLVEPLNFNEHFYCIPWHDGPECLMCRRDLFESRREQVDFRNRFGYELAPPHSWREFEDIARFFTRPAEGLYGTAFACYPDGHNTLYDFALQIWSRGGEFHDEFGIPLLESPQAIAALDFYRRVVRDANLCHPRSLDADSVQSGELFLAGSVAMMVNWFGFAARSSSHGAPLQDRVMVAPIPCDESQRPVSLSAFWSFAIASGSRVKQAAWEFLRFLARPEMDLVVVHHGAVGVRLSTWRDSEVQRSAPVYEQLEAISTGARRLPATPQLAEFAKLVNRVIESSLHTEESSSSILRRAQREAMEAQIRFC